MSLSRPINKLVLKYLELLYMHPIKTRALTSSMIALCGNATSQYVANNGAFNQNSLMSFGLFGLFFGGTIPHIFYTIIEKLVNTYDISVFKQLLIERLMYTPLYTAFSLYMLTRLEGHSYSNAVKKLEQNYWKILKTNWKWLTLITYLNLAYVPPIIRVLIVNLVGYFWAIFLAFKLRSEKNKTQ